MPESKLAQFLLVLFFSGSVVALGAHDLTTKHLGRSRGGPSGMARDLHGGNDVESPRANPSRRIFEVPARNDDMDRLDRGDRRELKNLLDSVVP